MISGVTASSIRMLSASSTMAAWMPRMTIPCSISWLRPSRLAICLRPLSCRLPSQRRSRRKSATISLLVV